MKVSIITVTYNAERFLNDCLQSVQAQVYPHIEHIVIDGASTDNTVSILKTQGQKIYRWISEKDNGMYDAINKGLELATGDIIGVLNSDDLLASSESILHIVEAFKQQNTDIVYGDLDYVDVEDTTKVYRSWKGKVYNRALFKKGWMPAHPTFYMKREFVNIVGGYLNHFYTAADYEYMSRCLFTHNATAYYLPELLIKMRNGGQSNGSIYKRLRANRRDYLAMKKNGIPMPFLISIIKPLSKLHQYKKFKSAAFFSGIFS